MVLDQPVPLESVLESSFKVPSLDKYGSPNKYGSASINENMFDGDFSTTKETLSNIQAMNEKLGSKVSLPLVENLLNTRALLTHQNRTQILLLYSLGGKIILLRLLRMTTYCCPLFLTCLVVMWMLG